MADATPRSYVYGIIAFTLVIAGFMAMYADFSAVSPSMLGSPQYGAFNSTFNTYNNVTSSVSILSSGITDADAEIGIFGVLNGLINTAWNSLKFIFTSFGFMSGVAGGLTTVFGVPLWIVSLLLLFVTVMLVFTIWSAIFQSEL
jgi:hypothetical protein